ncbi:hypothetical protein [Pseudomonas sp. L1(2025)]|uniref:hypothetical protein n=1 Tax=Pseudomonas sp. L1(2025) TaxID=3449429 RepID=UPI003F693031
MEIHRKGSNGNDFWARIQKRKSKAKPFALSSGLMSRGTTIRGPAIHLLHKRCKISDTSECDYLVELDFSEIAGLIDFLSGEGLEQFGDPLSLALSQSVRSLNRLMAAASGVRLDLKEPDEE